MLQGSAIQRICVKDELCRTKKYETPASFKSPNLPQMCCLMVKLCKAMKSSAVKIPIAHVF